MNKFPQAQKVLQQLQIQDAQYAFELQAFFDGLVQEKPNASEHEVGETRAKELYSEIVRAA